MFTGHTEAGVARAIQSVRGGNLSVIDIEGDAGFGKTTMIRRVLPLLEDFEVRRSFGEESADPIPFTLLDDLTSPRRAAAANAFHAARTLSEAIDEIQGDRPVAFVIDDLQWVDAESVDALATVALRSVRSQLLIVAAHRPLRTSHSLWRRVVRDLPAHSIRLRGLDTAGVEQLLAAEGSPPRGLAEAVQRHTGGNPLHIVALLQEHGLAELADMAARDELPVPAELAEHLDARIGKLSADAAQLLRALAVLGDDWVDLPTAAAVAGIAAPEGGALVLAEEGLVRVDRRGPLTRVRLYHSVIRAAVYEMLDTGDRRRLHASAAARHLDSQQRLRHRAAAATPGSDDGLASELAARASQLHAERRFRQAARLLRSAAIVARSEDERRRRMLEADIESVFGRDLERITFRSSEVADDPRERLVAAMLLTAAGEWYRAWRALEPVTEADLQRADPLLAFRIRCIRAWAGLYAGRPLQDVLSDAERAAEMPESDDALGGQLWLALAHARLQGSDEATAWEFTGRGMDRATLAETPQGVANLLWRGCAVALFGAGEEAVADLVLALELIGDGTMDFADVVYYGYLGLAEFQVGRWQRASIRFDIATRSGLGARVPAVRAFAPLIGTINADAELARGSRHESRLALVRNPYEIGIWVADIADVFSLAFVEEDDERRSWLARRISDLGDPRGQNYPISVYLWIVAHGLAASWAGDADAVRWWAEALGSREPVVMWHDAGVELLYALADAAAGEDASTRLAHIAGVGFGDVRVLTAVAFLEAARSASAHGEASANVWRARAAALVAEFGGKQAPEPSRRYAEEAGRDVEPALHGDDPLAALSEREREVAYLVKEGLSYAQIAQELFVTRSTVGFHLSNCYAKTNTKSRHELARLVRSAERATAG